MKKQNSLNIEGKSLLNRRSFPLFALPIIFILISLFIFTIVPVKATPSGATILGNITATASTTTPGNRSDAGGTITTLTLNTLQQDANWKAYVGNISGTLTLDDASGATIYQWALETADITGEVYVSRSAAVEWTELNCSDDNNITSEQTVLGFATTGVDNINRTFNYTTHAAITVAGRTITQNTCRSTATYVADAAQPIATADFQEVLLASQADVVYMTAINQGTASYSVGNTVDFQLIVPDDVTTASTRYYFYIEIGS